jgi:hypothetical protein
MPAKAGDPITTGFRLGTPLTGGYWMPAFAGMTPNDSLVSGRAVNCEPVCPVALLRYQKLMLNKFYRKYDIYEYIFIKIVK